MSQDQDQSGRMPSQVGLAILLLWVSWLLYWVTPCVYMHQLLTNPESNPEFMESLNQTVAQVQEQYGTTEGLSLEQLLPMIQKATLVFFGIGALLSAGLVAWVLHKVKRGRDWARVLCLIVGALNLLAIFNLPGGLYSAGTIGYLALGYGALFLLFTKPGANWFRPGAAQVTANGKDGEW